MKNFYLTFGQSHAHSVSGRTFDKDCVAVIKAQDEGEARKIAFDTLGDKWCFLYDKKEDVGMQYYSRGLMNLN